MGLLMKLSVKEKKFDNETFRNLFFQSQRASGQPITVRNKFLKNYLNEQQKKTFLDFCRIALEYSNPDEKCYWNNLLGN